MRLWIKLFALAIIFSAAHLLIGMGRDVRERRRIANTPSRLLNAVASTQDTRGYDDAAAADARELSAINPWYRRNED